MREERTSQLVNEKRTIAKILFVTFHNLSNVRDGGGAYEKQAFECLSKLTDAELLQIKDDKAKSGLARVCDNNYSVFIPWISDRVTRKIVNCAIDHEADFVVFMSAMFGKAICALSKRHIASVCFSVNCEYDYYRAESSNIFKRFVKSNIARIDESHAFRYAQIMVSLNQRDARRSEELYHRKAEYIVPTNCKDNFVKRDTTQKIDGISDTVTDGTSEQKSKRKAIKSTVSASERVSKAHLLFVGNNFGPNYQGILWFVKNVLPYISADLWIVGKNFENRRNEFVAISKKVKVIGTVPSTDPYYQDAAAIVSPIFSGAGMKFKTAEALMQGKYIFGTTEAFMGYDVDFNQVGGLCDDAKAFIEKINRFLTSKLDEAKSSNRDIFFNSYARQVFLEKYSAQAVMKQYQEIVSKMYEYARQEKAGGF